MYVIFRKIKLFHTPMEKILKLLFIYSIVLDLVVAYVISGVLFFIRWDIAILSFLVLSAPPPVLLVSLKKGRVPWTAPLSLLLCFLSIVSPVIAPIAAPYALGPLIDNAYSAQVARFRQMFWECGAGNLQCLWGLAEVYKGSFNPTYKWPVPKPRQLLFRELGVSNFEFVSKLTAAAKTGACMDFALGFAKLVEDATGHRTRLASFEEWDHMMPEIEVGGAWYVFDITYTTQSGPVRADEYARHLERLSRVNENIGLLYRNLNSGGVRIVDYLSGVDLTAEHGFAQPIRQ